MMGRRAGGEGQFFIRLISTRWCRPTIWSARSTAFSVSHTGRPSIDPVLDHSLPRGTQWNVRNCQGRASQFGKNRGER
jgi:hypothetical protein